MKKRYIFYFLLAVGLAWLVYYRISENKKIENAGQGGGKSSGTGKNDSGKGGASGKGGGMAVDGVVVQYEHFDSDLEITGAIEANESVALHSEISGLVTGIYFTEGSFVNKGAKLVSINDKDMQAQLTQAITKENLSNTNEGRAKQLLQKGAISQEEYDASLADLNTLKAQTSLIRTQLAKTTILAPFSGRIGLRSISVGEYLTPSTAIANLLSTNPVKVGFSVPEKYVAQIKTGSPITFKTDASSQIYTGKIYAIEPGINTDTRTIQIKALAQNPKNELIPGSFVKIKLSLSTLKDAILIPNEAIIPVLKGKVVYISENGKAKQVSVEAGTRTAENILITAGLKVGDTVLTTGAMTLKPEAPVKVNLVKTKY